MNWIKSTLCGAAVAASGFVVAPTAVQASVFDIQIDIEFARRSRLGGNKIKQYVRDAYAEAETLWEGLITGYQLPDAVLTGIQIDASVITIDGEGGVLGRAGPDYVYNPALVSDGNYYAYSGIMEFDGIDTRSLIHSGEFLGVVLHEMAHVIGFGTLWTLNGLYAPGSGQYTGAAALAAYRAEFDPDADFVPVELEGGAGTADAHWDENWLGGETDVMTGYLSDTLTYSDTTIHAFRDLGYTTVESFADAVFRDPNGGGADAGPSEGGVDTGHVSVAIAAIPLPAPGLALLAGLAVLSFLRIRRQA